MAKLKPGDKAPDFTLPASGGKIVSLKDYLGTKKVVLYFYPKDDTPGCTVEACGFRDAAKPLAQVDAVVLGVSADNVASHDRFTAKFGLPFLLVSDVDKKMCGDYGVIAEKSMFGKKYLGIMRSTFIIDKQGKVAKIFEKVSPQGHDQEVLEALRSL
ncbi:MAG: thioredoxin-dependent thiol peroxidase [Candidatus Omnitrophota bacterium]|nr:thioredoxin-dependent thiol peroxidase [Candidatus Omnitrophota bacterium]MDZ4241533.1 thioredoxin-dependent thiol peroxidase [Candidatus Omnitrophota bacterium]